MVSSVLSFDLRIIIFSGIPKSCFDGFNTEKCIIEDLEDFKESSRTWIFRKLKEVTLVSMPELKLGIGTIKTAQEAQDFIDAGADFIVAPVVSAAVAKVCAEADLLWVPGCMTPTEISVAQELGAGLIKIFPANILGQEFIASIKELFRGQLFMPTGGVDLSKENISSWFKVGVCAVGMGSKLISKDIMDNENYDLLTKNTKEVLAVIQSIK